MSTINVSATNLPIPTRANLLQPFLSICIPTYNRSLQLFELINNILRSERDDLQIIVLDNASTDDTPEVLRCFDDTRLIYKRNSTNKGWHYNMINSLLMSTGCYSVLLLDKDSINYHYIDDFCSFLKLNNPAAGFCEYQYGSAAKPYIFNNLSQRFFHTAYQCHHPTGYFFKTSNLRAIKPDLRFTDPQTVGLFPFEFIMAEFCKMGPTAIYTKPLFSPENLRKGKNKSSTHKMTDESAFFAPKERTRIINCFVNHSLTLSLPKSLLIRLLFGLFKRGLYQVTIEYNFIINDPILCNHYKVNTMDPGKLRVIHNGLRFVAVFLLSLLSSLLIYHKPFESVCQFNQYHS